ncbi:MAG: 4-hydroxy-3-methylbut-2-enyl diphosphate reductase [Streptosporangiaceae bacterium]
MRTLTVCAPLRVEARALRRGLAGASQVQVVRTGYGPARAAAAAARLAGSAPHALAVGGVAGALTDDLHVGDVVVAIEVTYRGSTVRCPSAPLLAGELRRAGLRASVGGIATVDHLIRAGQHAALAATGAVAVDMESAPLLAAATGQPVVVLRAISDTPDQPLASPGIVTGGLAALRSLRQAAPALARWAAAVGPRRVLLASPRSFCAGVERAIEIVELALEQRGAPVYVRKQIVHNGTVVADLERRGAVFVDELAEVPDGASVVFSAHGVSPDVRQEAARRRLDTVDATCPLVAKVHAEARRYAADGYLVAFIGHAGHEEVEGTLGEAPGSMALVEGPADVARLAPADPAKVAYLMQTTLATDEAGAMVDAITERFPAATGPGTDDICYATTNRQAAVRAIAARCDVVLVAGSANSSNSVRLVETAQRAGAAAYLVDRAEDIELGWLAGASTVGITAGASAPPAIVDQIVTAIGGLGEVTTEEVAVATESVQFGLPKELRRQAIGSAES